MPKLRNPVRDDIFGHYRYFVELEHMTKGQAKRKLRNAGCGPLLCDNIDIWQADGDRAQYGRAFFYPGKGWVVHLSKK